MSGASTVLAGELGYFKGGSGFPVRYQGAKTGQLPFFKVSDMNDPGNELFMRHANNYISEKQRKRLGATRIPAGAIVFAKVGAAVYLERKRILTQDSCIDNNMAAFVVDPKRLDVRLAHYLLTDFRLSSLVATTALPSLNGGQLRSIPLRVPDDLKEQRSIVDSLADVDSLISALERKVAKKQAVKQGVMQQLLTGRTRLPGFSAAWAEAIIGELASVDPESLTSAASPSTQIDYISLEDVSRGNLLGSTRLAFGAAPSRARRIVKSGDALFGTVRPNLQSHLLYCGGLPNPIASTGFAVVRANAKAAPGFIFHLLMSDLASIQIERIIAGSNYPAISSGDVRRLRFSIPEVNEQRAISEVLADADKEIALLRARLEKARNLKSGMMQQLLTGRTRLPVEAAR